MDFLYKCNDEISAKWTPLRIGAADDVLEVGHSSSNCSPGRVGAHNEAARSRP